MGIIVIGIEVFNIIKVTIITMVIIAIGAEVFIRIKVTITIRFDWVFMVVTIINFDLVFRKEFMVIIDLT